MHFCFDKDSDATMGRPPVEGVYSLVLTDINLTAGLRDFTSKGFYKPFFLSGDGINKTDMTALLEFIEAGMIEANRSFGVNKNMTLKDMPVWDTKEMLTAIKEVGMAVSTAYGVPPFMMNLVSDAGSMNAREQYAKFISSIVEPLVKYEAYVYSVILAKLGFKKTDVDITYKDTVSRLSLDRARVAKDLVNAGIITPNEARANYYNLPEIEGGDKLMKKSDLVPDVES
jgi:phage portal protein BeeE